MAEIYEHDRREWASVADRGRYLTEGLQEICGYAHVMAPTIKKRFDDAGFDPAQISSLKDLEKIPITTRDDFIRIQRESPPFGGFATVAPQNLKRIYIHPGPQYETLSDSDIDHVRKILHKVGVKKGDIVINTVSYHLVPAGLMIDDALTSAGITVVPTGVGNTDIQVQTMHDLKVTFFFGFPSFLMNVINRAGEMGYDFKRDFSLRSAIALGSSELRTSFEQDYGIDTREIYGFLPVGLPACECAQKSGMHIEEDFIVEIVDPDTGKQLGVGEVGEVVVTTIFNKVMPRIRIGSGDLSYFVNEPCPCGRTSPRLGRIVGRVGEGIKVRGMFIQPPEVADVVSHFSEISNYQLVVTRIGLRDTVNTRLELTNEPIDTKALQKNLKDQFNDKCRLKLDSVEFVPSGTIPKDAKKVVDERKEIIL